MTIPRGMMQRSCHVCHQWFYTYDDKQKTCSKHKGIDIALIGRSQRQSMTAHDRDALLKQTPF